MDKAPAYGAGDCRFESCLSQFFFLDLKLIRVFLIMDTEQLICDRTGPNDLGRILARSLDLLILVRSWLNSGPKDRIGPKSRNAAPIRTGLNSYSYLVRFDHPWLKDRIILDKIACKEIEIIV